MKDYLSLCHLRLVSFAAKYSFAEVQYHSSE